MEGRAEAGHTSKHRAAIRVSSNSSSHDRYDVPVKGYSADEFEAVFKFVADSGLWGPACVPVLAPLAAAFSFSVLKGPDPNHHRPWHHRVHTFPAPTFTLTITPS